MEQTDEFQSGLDGEMNQGTYMHIYVAHGPRQQCGRGLGGAGAGWIEVNRGKRGTSVIFSTIKLKF